MRIYVGRSGPVLTSKRRSRSQRVQQRWQSRCIHTSVKILICFILAFSSLTASTGSVAARKQFRTLNPCPSTGRTRGACPGYVVDHIQALKHGGVDEAGNMQWQSTEDARAKDRI